MAPSTQEALRRHAPSQVFSEGRTFTVEGNEDELIGSALGRKIEQLKTSEGEIDIGKLAPTEILELDEKGIITLSS